MVDKINETPEFDLNQALQDYAKQIVQNERESAQVFETARAKNTEELPFQKYGNIQSFLSAQGRQLGSAFTAGALPFVTDQFKNKEQKAQQAEESEYWEGYNWLADTAAYLSPLTKGLGAVGNTISKAAVIPNLGTKVAAKVAPQIGKAGQLATMGAIDMATYELGNQINKNSLTDFENANLASILGQTFLAVPKGAVAGFALGKLFGELNPVTQSAEKVFNRDKIKALGTMPKSSLEDLTKAYDRIDAQAKGEIEVAAESQLNPELFAWGQTNVTAQSVQNAYHFESIVQDADALLTKYDTMRSNMTEKELHDVRFYRGFLSSLAYNKAVRDEIITYGTTDLRNLFNQSKLLSDAQFKFRNKVTGEIATNPKIPLLNEIHEGTFAIYDGIRIYRNTAKDLEKNIPLEPINEQFSPKEQFNLINDIVEAPTSFLKSAIKNIKNLLNPKDGLTEALQEYRRLNPGEIVDESLILSTLEGERAGITTDYLKQMDGAYAKAATKSGFASKSAANAYKTYKAEKAALDEKINAEVEAYMKNGNFAEHYKPQIRKMFEEASLKPELERLDLKYNLNKGVPTGKVPKASDLFSMLMAARKNIGDVRFQQIGKFAPKEKANWIAHRTALQAQIDRFGPTAAMFSENTAALDTIDKALRGITQLFRTEGKPLTLEGDKIVGLTKAEIKKLGPSSESAGNLNLTEFIPKLNDLYSALQEATEVLQKNLGLDAAPILANAKVAMNNVKQNMDTLYAMNNKNVQRWYNWQKNLNRAAEGGPAPEGVLKEEWRLTKMALDFMLPGEQRFGVIQAVRFATANFKNWFKSNAYKEPFEIQLQKQIEFIRASNKHGEAMKTEIKSTLESYLNPAKEAGKKATRAILNYTQLQNTEDGKKKITEDFQETVMNLKNLQENPQQMVSFIQQTKAADNLAPEGSRKMTDRIFNIMQFLNSEVPKGPGMMEGGGLPPIIQQAKFNDKYLAATSPMTTLQIIKYGAPTPEHKAISKMFWPEFWAELQNQADVIILERPKLNILEKSRLKGLLDLSTFSSVPSMPTKMPTNQAPAPQEQGANQGSKPNISAAQVSAINKWQPQRQYGGFTQYGKPS